MLLAIDPGTTESAYVVIRDDYSIIDYGKMLNGNVIEMIKTKTTFYPMVIEMIASYGMPVGQEVFETCVWIGRFIQASRKETQLIYRKDVKLNICNSIKATDASIIKALKDRFGDKGTKANPGWFYGFSKDVWQAYALGVTYLDKERERL